MSGAPMPQGAQPPVPAGDEDLGHWVSDEPFDATYQPALSPAQQRYYSAPQWKLIWWKFRRHRLAVVSAGLLAVLYLIVIFAEMLAPYAPDSRNSQYIYAPPQRIHFFHEGEFLGPFVYGDHRKLDMEILRRIYTEDKNKPYPVRFFCQGDKYRFWGMVEARFHVICPAKGGVFYPLGTDRLGRDQLSRILYGARISLTVGLVGIVLSMTLGILIGGIAGYYGGWADLITQRIIELLRSFPELPLWMALSAALPATWSPVTTFFGITLIFALLDWTGLARAVRSKLLSLREEDFAMAASLMGGRPHRIIYRHLVPNFMSHLIASATLSIPSMILGETALSFLGLGLRPPAVSWGVLLVEAQNLNVVALYPWLMLPVVPVVLAVLAFNFLGDGLRDAADPYH